MKKYAETLKRLVLTDDWKNVRDLDTHTCFMRSELNDLYQLLCQMSLYCPDQFKAMSVHTAHWGRYEVVVPMSKHYPALLVEYWDTVFPGGSDQCERTAACVAEWLESPQRK